MRSVKDLVEQLKARNRTEALEHRRVYRPRGFHQSADSASRYQVKRIDGRVVCTVIMPWEGGLVSPRRVALATLFEHFDSCHTAVSGYALNSQNPPDYASDLK
jgi:hypothetical protein